MASTKLSAEDKRAIVKLYQEVGQTAATVAEQYGVSVSTISRLLKSELPPETYESLVRQKRGGGETKSQKSKKRNSRKKPISKLKKAAAESDLLEVTEAPVDEPTLLDSADMEAAEASSKAEKASPRRRRTLSSSEKKRPVSRRKAKEPVKARAIETTLEAVTEAENAAEEQAPEIVAVEAAAPVEETATGRQKPTRRIRPRLKRAVEAEETGDKEIDVDPAEMAKANHEEQESQPRQRTRRRTRTRATVEELPEVAEVETEDEDEESLVEADDAGDLALDDLTDALDSEDEDFDDAFDDDDDDDLEDEDDSSDNITSLRRRSSAADVVQIQPLSEANLSRMLYLVIDRTADLITMPMVFFSDLGELPAEEEKKKTLPVFENHRVARRFSQRNQRVIKVPDGELISKTAAWLEAKGITRCLLDGQVYSLESADL